MELSGQVALVTGSTSGIGRAAARLLAADGAEVVVTGRDAARGAETVAEIEADGGRARFVAVDLADVTSVRRLADAAGEVDVLVNNAGIFPFAPTLEQDPAGYEKLFDVNVRALFFLTAAIVPAMIAKGAGAIVNVSSNITGLGVPGGAVYSATKGAVEALTRTWAVEFGGHGVRVNTVSPGPTLTETVKATTAEIAEQQGKVSALGRAAAPQEIAEAVRYLASPRATYVTGATLVVDGGRLIV
ncbi:SDR family NAD(P)-dependent oxidoreductase [Actinosynnema sp. NPDC047251]|uniref:Short-chain dehydrogenase/reductase n=1 Tax=Saccharothrix espanaensis (strain ATCC 51144 / DSM 44229 / JCM 9112 / NBRC 15066 / NRRL 15764) TaxID=1179773 RepID=K0KA81_SACES|nr:SDR family NAD(P)-dependent oxidoreductase [Saccharothrix espanaensis]CCH33714.1 Short-chain dehydrogenase/reductase [Saccharothrix espanaensis DSM 44229]